MNCYIELRGKQHRVYWKLDGRKGYLPFKTREEAEEVRSVIKEIGDPEAVKAALQNPLTQPAATAVAAHHGPAAQARQLAGDLPARPGQSTGVTFDQLATSFLAGLTGAELRTADDYQSMIENHLAPYFGHTDIGLVLGTQPAGADTTTWVTVSGWVGWMRTRTKYTRKGRPNGAYADKTIRNVHGLLFSIFEHAVADELAPLLTRNPCGSTKLPKTERVERVFLEPRQFLAILRFVPEFWKALVIVLAGTGMRWAEAAGLLVRHVHLDPQDGKPYLEVINALGWRDGTRKLGRLKSTAARRRIYLSPELVAVLRPLIDQHAHLDEGERGRQHVFTTTTGAMLHHSNFNDRVFKPAVAKAFAAGLAPEMTRIHSLRHTCAAWIASSAGGNLEKIKERLGHESITTTDKYYGHLCRAAQDDTLAAIDLGLQGLVGTVANMQAYSAASALVAVPDAEDMRLPEIDIDDEDLAA